MSDETVRITYSKIDLSGKGILVDNLHKTIGDRVFPVAATKVWNKNKLPPAIT